jgi:hypothetical protein
MSRKNWDQVADQEFEALDQDTQKDWADLRNRVQ